MHIIAKLLKPVEGLYVKVTLLLDDAYKYVSTTFLSLHTVNARGDLVN